jgi:hypothetical protein
VYSVFSTAWSVSQPCSKSVSAIPSSFAWFRLFLVLRLQFSSIESLLIERHVMHIVDHASIVGLRTYFETKHFMFFVMELIHGGNTIDKVISTVGRVPENMYGVFSFSV